MSFRTHLFAPVAANGRLHWQSFAPPMPSRDPESPPINSPVAPAAPAVIAATPRARSPIAALEHTIDLVVIVATSADEPAVAAVLATLPAPLPVTVVLAAGRPVDTAMSAVLTMPGAAAIPVAEADHEGILVSGHVWIAPDARTLTLERRGNAIHTVLHAATPEDPAFPIDDLLASAAATFGARTLAVILSGREDDGVRGCAALRVAGGRIIVARATIAPTPDLPSAIAHTHLAHGAWPSTAIGLITADCIQHGRHDPRRGPASLHDVPPTPTFDHAHDPRCR